MSITMVRRNADGTDRTEETYQGAVLQTFERNGSWDSDFYAIVWDAETGTVKQVEYGTTRFPTYGNFAMVDATPEVLAKAQAWKRVQAASFAMMEADHEAKLPTAGKAVRILATATGRARKVKGEAIAPGTVAYVAGRVENAYTSTRWRIQYRVALQLDGRMVYLDDDAVEVVDPDQYLPTHEELEARLPPASAFTNFHTAVPGYFNMVA